MHADGDVLIETISQYSNARDFVGAWIEFKKSKRAGFSMRRLCALLELKSPNYLKLILDGKRGLTIDLGLKLSKHMGLAQPQSDYFISMIEAESSNSDQDFELNQRKILRGRRHLKTETVSEDKHELVSSWFHLLVRELTFLSDFEFSPDYVVRKLSGRIALNEAQRSLDLLLKYGLIAQGVNGKWTSTDKVLDTGDETFARSSMIEHHAATLKAWGEYLSLLNPNEQELGLLHVPISTDKIPELRRRIQQFQDELIGWLMTETKPDRVIQVGTYLIPYDRN